MNQMKESLFERLREWIVAVAGETPERANELGASLDDVDEVWQKIRTELVPRLVAFDEIDDATRDDVVQALVDLWVELHTHLRHNLDCATSVISELLESDQFSVNNGAGEVG